jgi:hypothetical protein
MTQKWSLFRFKEARSKRPQSQKPLWPEPEEKQGHTVAPTPTADVPPLSSEATSSEEGQPLEFDEEWYLQQNPDVATAVHEGRGKSGLEHYLAYGRNEGRLAVPRKQDS